jgi:hypothetical protein
MPISLAHLLNRRGFGGRLGTADGQSERAVLKKEVTAGDATQPLSTNAKKA